jgi:hypothetical protein
MKRKVRVLKIGIREREFENLLRRASEIAGSQHPTVKLRASRRRAVSPIAS